MQSGTKSRMLLGREWQGNTAPCNKEGGSQITQRALQEHGKGHVGEKKGGKNAKRQYQKCATETTICKPRLGLENFMLAKEQSL